jgi:hypothetical protein
MNNAEKFEKWIVQPLRSLQEVPGGGGAFVAIPIIMAVLNGMAKAVYFKSIGEKKSQDTSLPSNKMIADFLGIAEGSVYGWRHAMSAPSWQMFMIPKKSLRIDSDFGEVPTPGDDGYWQVDPWKFMDLVLGKAAENADLVGEGYFPLMRAYIEEDDDNG